MRRDPPEPTDRLRCPWPGTLPLMVRYHDDEWGVPVHDDRRLFEMLTLESAQAGLSWLTVLRKRDNYRRLFADFDPELVARFDEADVARLLLDAGIIRNGAKIRAAIGNARAFLDMQQRFGSFAAWQWAQVDGKPVQNAWREMAEVPAVAPLAERMAKDLKGMGFRFLGPTVMYAHLQAAGVVNDHLVSCFRHRELGPRLGG